MDFLSLGVSREGRSKDRKPGGAFSVWGELPPRTTTDLAHRGFGGLLLLACHIEALLGVLDPVKCLLE